VRRSIFLEINKKLKSSVPVDPGNNQFTDFFRRMTEQIVHGDDIQMMVFPSDTIFLDDIFYMFVLSTQGSNFSCQGNGFPKGDIQAQELSDGVTGTGYIGQDRNHDYAAVVLSPLADVDIFLPDDDAFGSL